MYAGSIPSELSSLAELAILNLRNNQLAGACLCSAMQAYTKFGLKFAPLSAGAFPPELGQLINLTVLSLPENALTGACEFVLCSTSATQNKLALTSQLILTQNKRSEVDQLPKLPWDGACARVG